MGWLGSITSAVTGARARRNISNSMKEFLTKVLAADFASPTKVRGFYYHGRFGDELIVSYGSKSYSIVINVEVSDIEWEDDDD